MFRLAVFTMNEHEVNNRRQKDEALIYPSKGLSDIPGLKCLKLSICAAAFLITIIFCWVYGVRGHNEV